MVEWGVSFFRPSHDLRYLSTTGRYHKCWKWWCLKIVFSSPPQEMGKFPYFPLRHLSTSGRYHKCWKSWCPKIVSPPTSKKWGNFPIFQSAGKTPSKPEGRTVTSATSRTGEFPPYFYLGEWIESPRKGSFFAHLFVLSFLLCLKTPSFY